ncbi:MAG TPA: DUF2917 domain-containing protein [Paucimonas sp.]|nr:DUF2917 domain-containing protein [Paucimonas sp.]
MNTAFHTAPRRARPPIRRTDLQTSSDLASCSAVLRLKRHQHMRFQGLRGWNLRALGGTVWITQDGVQRDVVLEAGATFQVDSDAAVMIGALGDADVGVSRATATACLPSSAPAGFLRRLLAPWPRVSSLFA